MRFKVDQNLPVEIADALRSAGHDADTGFGDIRSYPPRDYQGLVVLRPASQDKRAVLRLFAAVIPLLQREPIIGRLWIVEEHRIRTHG